MPTHTPPDTLPAKLYLLACDVDRRRLTQSSDLGYLLRGAVLADLSLRGCLSDDDGTAKVSPTKRSGDPVLDDALRELGESRPRSWRSLVRRGARSTLAAVQDQLVTAGVIAVEPRRVLGVFPGRRRVTVADRAQVTTLRAAVRDAVAGPTPVSAVPTDYATLVALATVGELRSAVSRRDARRHADRIEAFTEQGGRAVPALKRVLRQVKAARAAAAAGGGG